MIDESNGRENIAFIGERPWHGMGQEMAVGMSIDEWRKQSGVDFKVESSPVQFEVPAVTELNLQTVANRHVLYRADTRRALGIVGNSFKVVQPSEVMDFFAELCDLNGFSMEVAGSLNGGARVWGLAKVNEGANIVGNDLVRPYVLLATGYDGTLATHAKLTTVRVVCNNTLEMSVGGVGVEKMETDDATTSIRVPHRRKFDGKNARMALGIAADSFERFIIEMRRLAAREASPTFTKALLKTLLPAPAVKDGIAAEIEEQASFQRLLALCTGGAAMPTDPAATGSLWGVLNGITYYVDHERGRDGTRLNSAWFGDGAALKNKARDLLLAAAE
jgi:phage/plasmid-like protein (TIGR03299 family)